MKRAIGVLVGLLCLAAAGAASAKTKSCGMIWHRQGTITRRVDVYVDQGQITCPQAFHRFALILSASQYGGWQCRHQPANGLTCARGGEKIHDVELPHLVRQHRSCGFFTYRQDGYVSELRIYVIWGTLSCASARWIFHYDDAHKGMAPGDWACRFNLPKLTDTCDSGPEKIQQVQVIVKRPPAPPPHPKPVAPGKCGQVRDDLGGGTVLFALNIRGYSLDCAASANVARAFLNTIGCVGFDQTCGVYANEVRYTCSPAGDVSQNTYQPYQCLPADKRSEVTFKYAEYGG